MKKLSGIITIMLLASNISFATGIKTKANLNKEKNDTINIMAKVPFVPNATIYTPASVMYHDEVVLKRYRGYTLYDLDANKVVRINASLNEPKKLNLEAGEYILKLNGQKKPVYRISVLDNQYNEFVIK